MSKLHRTGIAAFAVSAILFTGAALAHVHVVKAGTLQITHPWSRATPGGAKVAGGYVTVTNSGAAPDKLLSAAADGISAKAEIHEVSMKDGVMSMKRIDGGIAVPPRSALAMKPGGYHIMFMGLKRPLKEGETFPGTLTFEKAGTVAVEFTVEALGAAAPSMPAASDPATPAAPGGMDHMHMGH